ncbi:antitoxin [Acetobacter malorum]|uniref:Antitoxin n=2 Tax=Acetobacter malorum TaxID=178901 RepID=A0A149S310_9PROT|nr:antitoxin [Acetobacter malorum]
MSGNTSVSLGSHFLSFVDEQVQSGRYSSTSETVRAGLRLLEEHETKVKSLQAALLEGERSGPAKPFDFDAFKARKRKSLERKNP